jgi:hypothetical protein
MAYHFLLAVTDINTGFENLYTLVGKLGTLQSTDQFFRLSRKHGAADNLYPTTPHHLSVMRAYIFHFLAL